MTSTVAISRRKSFWAWPGPCRTYEIVLVAIVYLPFLYFFRESGFAMATITGLTICFTYVHAMLRADLSAEEWSSFNRVSAWVIRICAAATGWWMFSAAPTNTARYGAVLAFALLYAITENAAWRRKRVIEAANRKEN